MSEPEVLPAKTHSRQWRWTRYIGWSGIALVLLLASGVAWLTTQSALDLAIARAVAKAEGRLTVEGATGSLLSTVRVARIAWRGDDIEVEADDMALTWSVIGLFSRHVNVSGLGAHRLGITMKESDAPMTLPGDLSLPLEVIIANVGVERVEWQVGKRAGIITGVVFDYRGGAQAHALRNLRFVSDAGTLTGNAELAAVAPFALNTALNFSGDGIFRDTRVDLAAKGTLSDIALHVAGTSREAAVTATASLAPFAPVLVSSAHIDARDVNVARFFSTPNATRLSVTLDAKPVDDGFAGTLVASNADAGAIDNGRVPLTAINSNFHWDGHQLVLTAIDARLVGDARIAGRATLPVDGAASRWQLSVRELDLHRIFSTLAVTRLSGTLNADVAKETQSVRGDLTQADLSLNFAATVTGRRVDVERIRGRAGAGEIVGRGRIAIDGERAFDFAGDATHFDPSRFGAFPAGSLTGTLSARGRLEPTWSVDAGIGLARGSQLANVAVSGNLQAELTARTVRDVAIKLAFGKARLEVSGAAGTPGDNLKFTADAEKVQELRGLLAKYLQFPVPETIAGALHVRGAVRSDPGGNGLDLDVRGSGLQWGKIAGIGTLQATTTIAPGGLDLDPVANANRSIEFKLAAARVSIPQGEFATLSANAAGTLAHHATKFALSGEGVDGHLQLTGGFKGLGTPALSWAGTLDALDNRGTYAVKLEAPTTIEWARDHLLVGTAQLQVAEGRATLGDLRWEAGKVSTRGAFDGIPLAVIFRIAGLKMPLASTLVLGGDWTIESSPQLRGVLHVRRERGDLYGTESASPDTRSLALGITALELEAQFTDDGVAATAMLRSQRAGNADATLNVKSNVGTPGKIPMDAPLTASLVADLPSLRPLQPWLGTLAVIDGRAHVNVTATGSLANPVVEGMLTADAVRVDVPQYGLHWQDGRLRGRVVNNALILEDLSFAGGEGRFTAKGTLARAPPDGSTTTASDARVTWTAEKFRAINRPDFQLTVGGDGVIAIENGKVAVRGNVAIAQGRIEYEPTGVGRLSDDVVIKGRPRGAANASAGLDVPLLLDLEVSLGDDLRFLGEGLDTGLGGKLHLTTGANSSLVARGTISAVNGTYFVFGQRLDIDHGQLIFDGPVDNPAIDVTALRRNAAVEAGVEVTGTVRVPRVRLVSNPPVPDGEKLSWLMTGQGLDRASRADVAALGAASAALVSRGQRPLTTTLANSIGLDDISLRERSTAVVSGTTTQVVAFGKRINDRLTLVYEQGLSVANNALRIEYALSRSLTLRAEAGVISSLGLYFRRSFE
ncbi:MAG: translocation/assembly module TamB domain-containing protein [Betaproteobacteria bacterium]